MSKKKSYEEYVKELAEINPNIEVMEEYVGARTKILHRCKICNHEWTAAPDKVLSGRGCPKCAGNIKLIHEEYVEKVKNINPNIEVLGKYTNSITKILHKCRIDGYEWSAYPCHILRGSGCPECAGLKKKTHEEYIEELAEINPNIEVIGKYININTKILHKCKIDGYEWDITPYCVLKMGQGCPKCFGNIKKTQEEYIAQVAEINPNIEVLGDYIDYHTKILHKCKIDGCEWCATPANVLRGTGCPKCSASKGERTIEFWLNENNILYEPQKRFEDCKNIKSLPFDFYLSDYNICVEYQGMQHYKPIDYFGGEKAFKTQILRDKIKEEYCKKNNILLLKIPYYSNLDEELIKLYDLITERNTVKEVAV